MGAFRERLRFRRWGKWILGAGLGFVLLSTISVEVTSQSSFCNSCHIMEPYYSSWAKGSHKNVECVECHISPGVDNFFTAKMNGLGQVVDDVLHRTSNKPSASVSVLSCTRSGCHTIETLQKTIINNGRFKFRHDKHIGAKHLGVEISCGTCHSHVRGDEHFEVSTNVCINCHMVESHNGKLEAQGSTQPAMIQLVAREDGSAVRTTEQGDKIPPSACTTCHDVPAKEIEFQGLKIDHALFLSFGATCESCHQGVTALPPPIDDGRCLECHTFGVEKAVDSHEMHRIHTLGRHKIECSSCHGAIRHGTKVQFASMERFECARCHIDQHNVQRSNYLGGSPHAIGADEKNPMFLAHVNCTGCHIKPRVPESRPDGGAQVLAAAPEACDRCHQAGYGAQMIPLWQKTTRKVYDQAEADLKAAVAAGVSQERLAPAKALLDQVHADGSWGVHNPKRTQQVLEKARAIIAATRTPGEPPK